MSAAAKMEGQLGFRINVRRLIFESVSQLARTTTPSVAETVRAPAKGILGRLIGKLGVRVGAA